ncbi:ribonuclease catalytic domain-containing protein, partial [Salidesulfovibrio brasiliensis]|uniref:ribonuclease catalytic domain-containing protein n=1 Tax=Salidesulfovibrio brasiliensis TaxID=221711 RepID=UPI0009FA9563
MAKPKLPTTIRPGAVIEFMQGDQPQLAFVLDEQSGKLRLWTINKREMKMPAQRALPWTGPEYAPDASRQEIQDILNRHQEKRGAIQAGIDVMELWELAQGELEEADLDWFAGLLWEEPTPDDSAALGRAMLSAKTHFKFRPPKFEIYSEETVEQRIRQREEEKAREAVTRLGQDLFRILWDALRCGCEPKLPPMDQETADQLADILKSVVADNLDDAETKIWTAVRKGLPDHPHLALLLAQKWGVLPPHHNFQLDLAGFDWGDDWSAEFSDAVDALHQRFEADQQPVDPTPFISVDGATTRDIDDAFFIERDGDGYRLQLALARPTAHWEFGSELDRAVFNRATSLYLPEGSSHMMPEALGTGLYSLFEGQPRPATVAEFRLDAEGRLLETTPRLAWVTVQQNTTYEAVEAALDGDDDIYALAHELSEKLIARRIDDGACIIRKPEPEVRVEGFPDNAEVFIDLKTPCPRAELMVSEFMILANRGLAKWAQETGVPLLHRTQAIALPPEAAGIFTDPA